MTSEVQKIKKEIERMKEHTAKCGYQGQGEFESGNREGRNYVCDKLLSFIDSLQEEPKCIYNRTLAERKKFCKYCSAFCTVRIKEEPASEDLEEEFHSWMRESCDDNGFFNPLELANHFAEWQHGKDFDDLLQSEMKFPKEFYEKGQFDMREEMMKDAVEAEGLPKNKGWVAKDYNGTIRLFFLCKPQRIDDKRYKYWYSGPNASKQLSNDSFPDLKWEDEPIEVELTIKKI